MRYFAGRGLPPTPSQASQLSHEVSRGGPDNPSSETYNQGLSERRADAVKQFLTEKYGIEAGSLVTVGYGLKQLKVPPNPFAPSGLEDLF